MRSPQGVIAAGHQITADSASEILEDGGSAFDAVLAGLLTACVPEVVLASIGGGGFLMAHIAEPGETRLYDFFAETPRRPRNPADLEFYEIVADFGPATQAFHIGAGSSATPGLVQGLFAVHDDLCRLPMSRLIAPAVRAARDGVTMTDFQAYLFTIVAPILTASDHAGAYFAPGGRLLEAGETYRNPEFAATLEALADEGARLFTEGDVAQAIVAQATEHGGHLTLDDLASYRVARRQPLACTYGDARIMLNPAPAAGGPLIAFGLGLLDRIPHPPDGPSPLVMAQVMAETNNVRAALRDIRAATDEAVLSRHLSALSAHPSVSRGTTHISVIDGDGNAAAATISNGEGNGHMVGDFGFMLNNMLGEEDLNPDGFHDWTPGVRLSSMMAPTIIRHGTSAVTALGSGGSNRIRTAILQVTVNLVERGLGLEDAVRAARLHVEKGGVLSFEDGSWLETFSAAERDALRAAYPDAEAWPESNVFFGGVHAVRRNADGTLEGAGDPRRRGVTRFADARLSAET